MAKVPVFGLSSALLSVYLTGVTTLVLAAPPAPPAHAAAPTPAAARPAPAPAAPAKPAPTTSAPAVSTSPAAPTGLPPASAPTGTASMTGAEVIEMLDETTNWYRTLGLQQSAANEPSDQLFLYGNRQTANQVIGLAFEVARANADVLAKQPSPADSAEAGSSSSAQTLVQLQNKLTAQASTIQTELETDQLQLSKTRGKPKVELQSKIAELHGELDLINARQGLLTTLSTFANQSESNGYTASALKAQIDAMAVTVPANGSSSAAAPPTPTVGTPGVATPGVATPIATPSASSSLLTATPSTGTNLSAATRFGIWDLAANVVRLSEKMSTIKSVDTRTGALQNTFARIRAPLIEQLKALSARGDALAAQADAADATTLDRVRSQLDALADEFRQTSALLIPLSKESVLLNQYRRNLGNWHDAVKSQSRDALKTLAVRLGVLLVLLAAVFFAAEAWRRAAMRYVQDSRRRYQLLLLRKIALWSLVVLIVGFACASELGSIVTFAGLITAGLAVAMQSVLVSIVGYFFLIGKYGIRVGDRVQIGEVTGEVIDLGLVRMYLMELGGHGALGPTGRVVAFANSIVFQVSSGLFKQIPGVNVAWHEITFTLAPGINYTAAKEKLLAAAVGALKDFQDEIVRQTQEIQKTTASNSDSDAKPHVQLNFTAAGIEAHIRYPVHLQRAAEIDERVSQEVVKALDDLAPPKAMPPTVAISH